MKLTVQIGWICLAVVSWAVLMFDVAVAVFPMGGDTALYRADGLASAGLGLFGGLVVFVTYRRIERRAWCTLWFYPVFWSVHLFGNFPPGTDHIHQVVFIALSLIGLVLPIASSSRTAAARLVSGFWLIPYRSHREDVGGDSAGCHQLLNEGLVSLVTELPN